MEPCSPHFSNFPNGASNTENGIKTTVFKFNAPIKLEIDYSKNEYGRKPELMLVGLSAIQKSLGYSRSKTNRCLPLLRKGGYVFYRRLPLKTIYEKVTGIASGPLFMIKPCSFDSFIQLFKYHRGEIPKPEMKKPLLLATKYQLAAGLHIGLASLVNKWIPALKEDGFIFSAKLMKGSPECYFTFENMLHAAIIKHPELNAESMHAGRIGAHGKSTKTKMRELQK